MPTLMGRIAQVDRGFSGLIDTKPPRPLPNTIVRVNNSQQTFQTQSDEQGSFQFYGLPSGKYSFAPDLPAGTQLSWYINSDNPLVPFDVQGGTCQARDVAVFASGAIQGRVLDPSGGLLPGAFVYILPVEQATATLPQKQELYWDYQNKKGFFKFVHLPPGDYLLVVNPNDERDPAFPYQRSFYPGVRITGGQTAM